MPYEWQTTEHILRESDAIGEALVRPSGRREYRGSERLYRG